MATFDPVVFDISIFDVLDPALVLYKVFIERQFRKVTRSSPVVIGIVIQNVITTPGRRFNANADVPPTLTIYDPSDTIEQTAADMYNVGVGFYQYAHSVDSNDPLGVYSGVFTISNGTAIVTTPKIALFEVI